MKLGDFLSNVHPGESVLIEYTPLGHPERTLWHLLKWASSREVSVLVVDLFDSLYLYREQLKLSGYDVSLLDNVSVVKGAGHRRVGNILGEMRVMEDISVYMREYYKITKRFFELSSHALVIVLGGDRLVRMYREDPWALEEYFERTIKIPLTHGRKVSVSMCNVGLLPERVRRMWEMWSTRVLEGDDGGERYTVRKSPFFAEIGGGVEL